MVTIEGVRLVADEFESYPRRAQSAVVRALNRGMTAGRTLMARAIAKDTTLKVGDVTKGMRQHKATSNHPVAELASGLTRIPLLAFNARQTSRGVTYRLGSKSRGRLPHAFIATMPTGHRGVFMRTGRPSKRNPKREAISERRGPSLGHVFAQYRGSALERAEAVFTSTLDHELSRLRAQDAGA